MSPPKTYPRGSEEFARTLALSDGVFAIALTLLVVSIGLPSIGDAQSASALWGALGDLGSNLVSFVISFAVIGRYWIAHQRQFSMLARMDGWFMGLNLVYLASIAFLPFPTDLLGTYFHNPVAVGGYALCVALVSGMEVVLFHHAHRAGLLTRASAGPDIYRWGLAASCAPVAVFLFSIPLAFVSTIAAVLVWALTVPVELALDRSKPPRAEDYLG